MGKAGKKIIDGLKDALAGNFSRVTIDGQTWVRLEKGQVVVPQAALDWLDGSAPAPDGRWFGQDAPDPDETPYRRYWWRSRFRELCSLPNGKGTQHGQDR